MHSQDTLLSGDDVRVKSITNALALLSIGIVLCLFGPAYAQSQSDAVDFNIPRQPVELALEQFAIQARLELTYADERDDGIDVEANAVAGKYLPMEALQILLRDTGLQASLDDDNSVVVKRAQDRRDTSSGLQSATNQRLLYAHANSEGISDIGRTLTTPSDSQQAAGQAVRENEETGEEALEEITVTGSRIRGAQSASPVITVTRADLDLAGFATVEEFVDKLPQNFGAGTSLDISTDFANTANVVGGRVDARAGGTSVNLRGLGASATLVLLNGRRISPSGLSARFTNISSIPVTAIERVDVLTDGASAIYGSDAIGGVINFILRDDYEGAETRVRYGTVDGGHKPEVLIGQSFGDTWGGGRVLLTYEYYDSDNLANSQREFTSTNDLSRFGGTDRRLAGGRPAVIQATLPDGSSRFYAIPAGQDGTNLTPADFDPTAPFAQYNNRSVGDVVPAQERHSAFIHLEQEIGLFNLFAEAHYGTQETETVLNRGLISFNVPETNAFFVDPTGTGEASVRVLNYSFEEDIPNLVFGDIDTMAATTGAQFNILDTWDSSFTLTFAQEDTVSARTNDISLEAFVDSLAQSDPALALNLFGDSPINPNVIDRIVDRSRIVSAESENQLWSIGFDVTGDLLDLPGGALQLATGVNFREESLKTTSFLGTEPRTNSFDREVFALYTELFFPLVGTDNAITGLRRLELSVAARYEDYSDFGNQTTPKIGVLLSPVDSVLFRGTLGAAFRAPALFDLDETSPNLGSANYFPQEYVDRTGFLPFPLIVRRGGNEDLKAEEAITWTAGVEWTPVWVDGFSLDLTYFSVDFEDRIDNPTNRLSSSFDPRFAFLLNTNPTPEEIASIVTAPNWLERFGIPADDILSGAVPVEGIFDLRRQNLAQLVVTGMELQLSYEMDTNIGDFNLGLNAQYLFDYERRLLEVDPLVEEVDTFGRPIDFQARANLGWNQGPWTIAGFVNYSDGYTDNVSDPERPVDSWTTFDMSVSFQTDDAGTGPRSLFAETRFTFSAQNVLNEDPPFVDTEFGLAYDSTNANPFGRILAIQLSKDW